MKANVDIREEVKNKGVHFWEVAEALEIQDSALSRKLRRELPQAEKEKVIVAIQTVAAQKGGVSN